MELDVSKIERNQPPGIKYEKPSGLNTRNSSANRSSGKSQSQRTAPGNRAAPGSSGGGGQSPSGRRPETSVARNREQAKQQASEHIPIIVCDEVNEGDTPTQTRGADTGVTGDNTFLLQCPESEDAGIGTLNSSSGIGLSTQENVLLQSNAEKQPQKVKGKTSAFQPPANPHQGQGVATENDQDRRVTSARSRKGSAYGQGSPKRQGETYVERLAKSRARSGAQVESKAPPVLSDDEALEIEAILLAQLVKKHSYANRKSLANLNLNRHTSQLHTALAEFVAEDLRQTPQSFTSTPLLLNENRKSRTFRAPAFEHTEVNDADFDSDGEEKSKSEEDVVSIYERACRMAGITSSSRIARELVNNKVFLDYAGLNTQDIKAVCVALLSHSAISRLDLSGNELSCQAVQYVCELIEENIFITHLFLATCQLREKATNSILQTITTSKNITTMDLSENKLHDEQLELIATMLKKNNNLRELRLSYCDIDEEGGFILSKALEETTLEILDLSWNHLRQRGATAFCMALGDNDSIRELDLSWNGLGREGCAGLEAALSKNKYLVQLNLECNRVSSESLGHLLKGLEKNSSLETLILSTNPLAVDDAKMIASVLKTATKTAIKVIDIFDVTVDDDFLAMQEELEERGISIYYGNILQRPKKEIKAGPRTLGSFDPILVLFEYMKQQNLRLIDLFRSLDVNRDNAISREELRNGFMSLNMHLPEGVFSAAFNKLDLNSNNLIDIDELKNAHRRVIRQTALMMLRSRHQEKQKDQDGGDRTSDRVDLLHEFQKLVKDASIKRKTVKLKDESEDEGGGGEHSGRKLPIRPTVMRRGSALTPASSRNRRPSSGAGLNNMAHGQHNSEGQGQGRVSKQTNTGQAGDLNGKASPTTVKPT